MLRSSFIVPASGISILFLSFFTRLSKAVGLVKAAGLGKATRLSKARILSKAAGLGKATRLSKAAGVRLSALLLGMLLLQVAPKAYAVTITYTGNASDLQSPENWASYPWGQVFLPGTPAAPIGSANNVTIDFVLGTNPQGVYGGLSKTGNSQNNLVTLIQGTVSGIIIGGAVAQGAGVVSNNHVVVEGGNITASIVGGRFGRGYSDNNATGSAINNTVTIKSPATVGTGVTGGQSEAGEAKGNIVNVDGATLGQSIWGGTSTSGLVSENKINVTNGATVAAELYGGSSITGNVSKNEVLVNNSTVQSAHNSGVHGGQTNSGNVTENSVIVSGTSVVKDIIGGRSVTGSAIGNTILISGTASAASVSGGMVTAGSGDARGNSVTMTGGTVTANLTGGRVSKSPDYPEIPTGNAIANSLNVSGGTVNIAAFGGQSTSGYVKDNTVTISGTALFKNNVFGGFSYDGYAVGNTLSVQGGTVQNHVYGGRSNTNYAQGNSVSMSGGTVGGIYGAYSASTGSYASNNNVAITGGTVTGFVYGGRSESTTFGEASNNSVTMNGGNATTIYGAHSATGKANNNEVDIKNAIATGDIYGGYTASGSAANNNTVSIGSNVTVGVNNSSLVYAGFALAGAANNNSVSLNGGTVNSSLYGGYGFIGSQGNTVSVVNGQAGGLVGGFAATGDATNNNVNTNNSVVLGSVYAGFSSAGGSASNNNLNISNSNIYNNTVGGYSAAGGNANNNSVSINGSGIAGALIGGFASPGGDAKNNSVYINNSIIVGTVFAGYAHNNKDAVDNTITISGTSNLANATLVGGYRANPVGTGDVFSGNTLNIDGFKGNVKAIVNFENINFILSSPLQSGDTVLKITDNIVTNLTQRNVNLSFSGNPLLFQVGTSATLIDASAGSLAGSINRQTVFGTNTATGIWTYTLATANNKLDLFVNELEINNLNAGTAYSLDAGADASKWAALRVRNNLKAETLTMSSNVGQLDLSVGGVMEVEDFTATKGAAPLNINVHTLDVTKHNTKFTLNNTAAWNGTTGVHFNTVELGGGKTLKIDGSGTFDFDQLNVRGKDAVWDGDLDAAGKNISIFLSPTAHNNDTMLTVTGAVDTSILGCSINTYTPAGAPVLVAGDKIHLISTSNALLNGTPNCMNGSQGISLLYDFSFLQLSDELYGIVNQVAVNPQTKSLPEGKILGLGFVNQGANLLAEDGIRSLRGAARVPARLDSGNRLMSFGATSANQSRLNTGSYIDFTGASLIAGIAWDVPLCVNYSLVGAFLETGVGSYNSYNSFSDAASVKGGGNTEYYGGGILWRYDIEVGWFNNMYFETSLRGGYASMDFSSDDLHTAIGQSANYSSSAFYYGAHLGFGYIWKLNKEASLDFSSKYLWTHQNGDSLTVAGDPVVFKASNSHRWQNGVRFKYEVSQKLSPYLGLEWEYEFDGQAKATAYGYAIDPPSLQGNTISGEFGAELKPTECRKFSLTFGLQGYVGKREGVGANFNLKYEF